MGESTGVNYKLYDVVVEKKKLKQHGLEEEVSQSSGERDSGEMSPQLSVLRTEKQERATERTTLKEHSLLEVHC